MNVVRVPEVGQRIETWFSEEKDGKSTVLAVEPYRGKYPQWYTHMLRLSAPRTRRGWLEMAYDARFPTVPAMPTPESLREILRLPEVAATVARAA